MKSPSPALERKPTALAAVMLAAWSIGSCGVPEEPTPSEDRARLPSKMKYEVGLVTYDELQAYARHAALGRDGADEGNVHHAIVGARRKSPARVSAVPGSLDARERDFLKGGSLTVTSSKVTYLPKGMVWERFSVCDGKRRLHFYRAKTRDGGTTTVQIQYVCHRADTCETKRKCGVDLLLEAAQCVFGDTPYGSGLR